MTNEKKESLRYAFPRTIPVMVGYLALGAAYGILMKVNGFGIGWTMVTSLIVYAGSLQYLGVTFLSTMTHPLSAFFMSLMLNARHLFYGLSMLGKFGPVKKGKPYLIFGLTDETFSVLCNEEPPKNLDRDLVFFWITFLDHMYWIAGSVLGAICGSFLTFDTKGLDFAMTALFAVIFTEQWSQKEGRASAVIGVLASVVCLSIWGSERFIVPAMAMILGILTLRYQKKKREGNL